MHIDFYDKTTSLAPETISMLHRLLQFAAKKEKIAQEAEISINIVTDSEIQEINRNYRGKDSPTDVISFAMQETIEGEMEIKGDTVDFPLILGDIIISIDRAKEQAAEYNHSFAREMGFLCVHGLLHLLGYDHMNEADEKIMFQKQDEILGEFNLER